MKIKNQNKQNENKIKTIEGVLRLIVISIFILMTCFGFVYAVEQNIFSCGTISSSGNYVLNESITSTGTCLTISADDVELDCRGNTIEYNTIGTSTRMGINAISGTTPRTNLTIKNCVLVKPTNLQTAGYGIMLTRFSNSSLINNTIYTNGTTNNYGIYLITNSENNTLENNTVYSYGTSSGNYGIYIYSGTRNNIIKNNNVFTYGTSGNYGIYVRGISTADADNNLIENNLIYTYGTSTTNYGIYLLTNANNNTIKNNKINAYGVGTAHGIYVSGVTTPSDNNKIIFNNISTNGSGASNYGILLYRDVSYINISNNNISTAGTTTNYGIYLVGTTAIKVDNNIIDSNIIQTQGTTGGSDFGIYLSSNANNNNITNNIIQTNGTTTRNYGVQILGTSTLSSDNNFIYSNNISTDGTTTNYGIYIVTNANYNKIKNNYISTFGTTSNYGIYVSGSTYEVKGNEIYYNNINTNGSHETASNNPGIYLYRNVSSNEIFNNNITTEGTASSYGIVLGGTTNLPINNNLIAENIISAFARLAGNSYGIYATTNINENNISNNKITTSGTTANYGIYLLGAANLASNNNIISSNNIRTLGTTTNNYGVIITTNVNNNLIEKNNISTFGLSGNAGIYLAGSTTLSSENNVVQENNIKTDGSSTGNYGVYVLTNAINNTINKNIIQTNGTGSDYGVYLSGTSFNCNNNEFSFNNISAEGSGLSNYGVYLYRNVAFNNFTGNTIKTTGTGNDFGIYLYGTSTLYVDSNLISSNELRVNSASVIVINAGSTNNTFNNNIISERNDSYYDINVLSAQENGTKFIDQYFESYNFGGAGESISIKNTDFGEILFSERISGSSLNLNNIVSISDNYAYVDSSNSGFNKSAIISLYNLNYDYPLVLRDGFVCVDCNILSNSAGVISFSVSHFSGYSIGDNAILEVFDDSDISASFEDTKFYANYTNRTSNLPITTASCNITYNGSSELMSYNVSLGLFENIKTLPVGVHIYDIFCSAIGYSSLNASDYATIGSFSGPNVANVTVLATDRANISSSATNMFSGAGNVTQIALNASAITNSWQGYYGSVGGQIFLKDNSGAVMYDWNITQPTGNVYAVRTSNINFATIKCSELSEIIAEELFMEQNSADPDSVRNTFNKNNHPQFSAGMTTIYANTCNSTNMYVNSSGQDSYFYEVLLSDGASNRIYTALIDYNKTGFNNNVYDFQMLVGENGNDESLTPYYFFVEIN